MVFQLSQPGTERSFGDLEFAGKLALGEGPSLRGAGLVDWMAHWNADTVSARESEDRIGPVRMGIERCRSGAALQRR